MSFFNFYHDAAEAGSMENGFSKEYRIDSLLVDFVKGVTNRVEGRLKKVFVAFHVT